MNFEHLLSGHKSRACIISVEKYADGSYGNIRIAAANKAHCDDMVNTFHRPFIPDSPYAQYLPEDKNFEDFMYRSACLGEQLHTYVNVERMGIWVNMFLLPLESDKENVGYCLYSYDVKPFADSEQQASLAADTASAVLENCIKLRGADKDNIRQVFGEIIEDLRNMCGADQCCIILTEPEKQACVNFCESISPESELRSIDNYINESFYNIVSTFDATIGGSSCAIIKDENDRKWFASINPEWHSSLIRAGINSLVLFPLKHNSKTLGYLFAFNFRTEDAVKIKETLELSTFFIASEIANYQLMQKLEILSSTDMLTGCKNRNAMNSAVNSILSGKTEITAPYAVVFADLNGLKRVNDEKGHSSGDRILRIASAIISQVFSDCEVYRAGGDEFMLIATEISEDAIKARLQQLRMKADAFSDVHFAVGYCFAEKNSDILTAMRIADERMYIDKKAYYEEYPERKYR